MLKFVRAGGAMVNKKATAAPPNLCKGSPSSALRTTIGYNPVFVECGVLQPRGMEPSPFGLSQRHFPHRLGIDLAAG